MPTLTIRASSATYPVIFDTLLHAPDGTITHNGKVLLISNPKVAGLYLHKILPKIHAKEIYIHIAPDGEEHKNLQSIEQILDTAFAHKLDRKSLMIALGGGVISDMVGFASGVFERGISYISIPTTLLAQVDASVGGKCGVNNAYGKNLIGLFHQPKAVYIDTDFLHTLSPREICAGLAEAVKVFVCFSKESLEQLESTLDSLSHTSSADTSALHKLSPNTLLPFIQKAIEIKARVVEQDERESGVRAALNYGHTFAHAIEMLTAYKQFLHGEAVAIGMKMANALAYAQGLLSQAECERIDALLHRIGTPQTYTITDIDAFYNCFFLDKKSSNNTLRFVLPKGIGDFVIQEQIPKEQILAVLERFSLTH